MPARTSHRQYNRSTSNQAISSLTIHHQIGPTSTPQLRPQAVFHIAPKSHYASVSLLGPFSSSLSSSFGCSSQNRMIPQASAIAGPIVPKGTTQILAQAGIRLKDPPTDNLTVLATKPGLRALVQYPTQRLSARRKLLCQLPCDHRSPTPQFRSPRSLEVRCLTNHSHCDRRYPTHPSPSYQRQDTRLHHQNLRNVCHYQHVPNVHQVPAPVSSPGSASPYRIPTFALPKALRRAQSAL